MPDEVGTKAVRSDAPGADDSLFGDAADDEPAAAADEQDTNEQSSQDEKADDNDAEDKAGANETDTPEDLKVVVSIKGGRATIGVKQPSSDPYVETFDVGDLSGLARETPAVVERARAKWETAPKHPVYERPTPPGRRRNRRGQGAAQGSGQEANAEEETAQAQQQTLRLF